MNLPLFFLALHLPASQAGDIITDDNITTVQTAISDTVATLDPDPDDNDDWEGDYPPTAAPNGKPCTCENGKAVADCQDGAAKCASCDAYFKLEGAACIANDNHRKEDGLGGWGGTCTCPSGESYKVGDNGDSCGSLACEGGEAGACTKANGNWSGMKATCAFDNHRKEDGIGGWGGVCTCPSGKSYNVGDNGDSCGSLACEGGKAGACNKRNGDWGGMKVTCAGADIYHKVVGIGGFGGLCTCPSGVVYGVGDNGDSCGSLACVGGSAGACNKRNGDWSGMKVTCSPAFR